MQHPWTDVTFALATPLLALALAGCASKDTLLPPGDHTMLDLWRTHTSSVQGAEARLNEARQLVRRPLSVGDEHLSSSMRTNLRQRAQALNQQFPRLPNPDLVMYVFPHLAGEEAVPVPGYSTVFPLYRYAPYALPGERVEDY
ncbi:TIGR03751 family conjugal transfer lipoprotein [Pseudomonas sp. 102515]|uniref:TIGR03751 family conjugal transfer lipoprotein n=1 Tax=Pseudomonas sp. 102515 TaxID=3071568 RepID=UPI002801CAC3|nr:TIGR03751 family conjugal transfer lipoprotein [Pseudomonas sp. 102515]MDQ7914230.1 TIGR03751 family conjugal transfer lipoprotein [Pseudomonas sp. 102515]